MPKTETRPIGQARNLFFDSLMSHLDNASHRIKKHVDHFIAHATNDSGLSLLAVANLSVGELLNAHRELCQLTGFVSLYVLGGYQLSFYAHPLGDPFEYMDMPLVDANDREQLEDRLKELEREYHILGAWVPIP